jgi:MinD-like ATPase involved in chromosome partitioning or flagellar assembly
VRSSGPEPLRVIAITGDPSLLESLRRDKRLTVLAHIEDADLARQLAATVPLDAIFIDESRVAPFLAGWQGRAGGAAPDVYVLRAGLPPGPSPAPAHPSSLELKPDLQAAPAANQDRLAALTPDLAGTAAMATLRDWWLASRSAGVSPAEAGSGPAVLMREVIAVVSPKGGVGKTFVSVNLAASLARHTGFRILLLDLDLHSGDAAVHLDLIGRPTLADLVPYAGNLESQHLERGVVTHAPSRLDALLAPPRPEAAELIAREHLGDLLRVVRQRYDFVVIDTPPDPSDPVVGECLREASSVILVSSLDAAALRQCRLFLDSLGSSNSEALRRLSLVLNQAHERGPLSPERAAAFLGSASASGPPVSKFTVPEDRAAVERSVFEGRPLTVSDPAHPIAKAIYELAHAFCPVFGPQLCGPARKRPGLRGLVEAVRRW